MRDIATKVTGSSLTADEFNDIPTELENAITSTDITLSAGDLEQLSQAIATYAAGGAFYTDTGSSTLYELGAVGNKHTPIAYFVGMSVSFVASNNNTTATPSINVAGLGSKNILADGGGPLSVNDITTSRITTVVYNGTDFTYDTAAARAPKSYKTVASMVEDLGLVVGQDISLTGYTTDGDGGAKTGTVVAGATGTDDGGSYHDLDNGNQFQLNDIDEVNVKQFGALGDGSTDDILAIQAVIDFLSANGGGVCRLPRTDNFYVIADTIQIKPHVLLDGGVPSVNVQNEGTLIFLQANSDVDMVRTFVSNAVWPPNVVDDFFVGGGLQNLKLDGNKNNQTGANDPVTGDLPNCITAARFIELAVLDHMLLGNAVGYNLRVEASSLPVFGRDISLGSAGVAGLSIGDFVSAGLWENISASNNPAAVSFDSQVEDISGHCFINAHFEQNGTGVQFNNANIAPIQLINYSCWGKTIQVTAVSGNPVLVATNIEDYMVNQRIHIPGAGVAAAALETIITVVDTGAGTITLQTAPSTTDLSPPSPAEVGVALEYIGSNPNVVMIAPTLRELAATIDDDGVVTRLDQTDLALYVERGGLSFGTGGEIISESFIEVGSAGAPAFENSWANFGVPFTTAAFRKDPMGIVHIKGTVSGGADETTIFTLPTGYRPAEQYRFSTIPSNQTSTGTMIEIKADGTIFFKIDPTTATTSGIPINFSFIVD